MGISRVKTWVAGEILYASDLNTEFSNIIDNALNFISPLTGTLNADNNMISNLRLERFSATQTAGVEARIYYHTSEDSIHIDDGSGIRRVPTMSGLALGSLIVSQATGFAFLAAGSNGQALLADSSASTGLKYGTAGADVLQVQVFS